MRVRCAPRRRETRRSSVGGLRPPAPRNQTAVGRRGPPTHDDLKVLVAASGQADERDRVAAERRGDLAEVGDGVRRLERRDDPLGPREEHEARERLRVGARDVLGATALREQRVLRTHPGVIQAGRDGVRLADLGAEELHPEDVRLLAARVDRPHVHDALEPEERARRGARDAVLARAGLGDDALLPHPRREERLADRTVDLVRARVREILALEEDAREADRFREARRVGEWRGPSDPVAQETRELVLESGLRPCREPGRLELRDGRHERLRQVLAAELAVAPRSRRGDHTLTVLLIAVIPRMSGAGSPARMSEVPTSTASTRAGSRRASSTDVMPDSATRTWPGSANVWSWRMRPGSSTLG